MLCRKRVNSQAYTIKKKFPFFVPHILALLLNIRVTETLMNDTQIMNLEFSPVI